MYGQEYYDAAGITANRGNVRKDNGKEVKANWSDSAAEWWYKQNEAALNHQYAIESANIQNQMQIDQWRRENAYNDPAQVAARYRAAGISPQAAMGGAASGAGLAHSVNTGAVGSGAASGSYGHDNANKAKWTNIALESANLITSEVEKYLGTTSQVELNKSTANLNNAKAEQIRDQLPTSGRTGDYNLAKLGSETHLNDVLVDLNKARTDEAISNAAYNRAKTATEDVNKALKEWQLKFNNDNRQNLLNKAEYSWKSAQQMYEFNESKNPLVLKELRLNCATQMMGLVSAEIANRLAEKKIDLTQAQITNYIAQDEKLRAEAIAIGRRVVMEESMQGYRKAESVVRMFTGVVDTVVKAGSAIATGGISQIGNKTEVPNSVNGIDVDDFLTNIAGY